MSDLYDERTDPLHWTHQRTVTREQLSAISKQRSADAEAAIQRRIAREQADAEAEEIRRREEGRQRLADYEGQTHQRFLNNGGSEADWRAAWPALKAAWLTSQVQRDPVAETIAALRTNERYSF